MMKRWTALVLALLLLPCGALAGGTDEETEVERALEPTPEPTMIPLAALETVPPETETYPRAAVAAGQYYGETVPLYAAPDEDSEVLMEYYRGARLTVLRAAKPGFVQVQCGTKEAGLLGYMREEDLRVGSAALREIRPEYVMIRLNRETPIYAYCDELSAVIGTCNTETKYYTIGKNDGKWVQLFLPVGAYVEGDDGDVWESVNEDDGAPCGFVLLETGLARGYEYRAIRWEVEPLPGEITREQAVDLAIWATQWDESLPEKMRDERALRQMDVSVTWMHSPPDIGFNEISVRVDFEDDDGHLWTNITPQGELYGGNYEEAAEGS